MEKKEPLRMCVACRRMLPKSELFIKAVKSPDGVVSVANGRAPGRGAYICKDPTCVEKAVKRKLLNKHFSCDVPASVYAEIAARAEVLKKE
ncbi:MAG: YlxR family protein [Clostridiales bacterium]|nr:YlxR family protein [Clostridiales bacterium]